jgi:hypothetical protein
MSRTLATLTLGLVFVATDAFPQGTQLGEGSMDPCHAFTPDADYVDTTVIRQLEGGEVTLRVPEQYFEDFWDRAGGFRDTAQLFRVDMATWEPVSRRESSERTRRRIRDWMTFVVSDLVSLDWTGAVAADLSADVPLSSYPPRPGPHGLTWLETPFASDQKEPHRDVFIYPPTPAPLQTVIECSSPNNPTSRLPVCTQHFRAADLDTRVSYRRVELEHWREVQAQITAFLTCATSAAS